MCRSLKVAFAGLSLLAVVALLSSPGVLEFASAQDAAGDGTVPTDPAATEAADVAAPRDPPHERAGTSHRGRTWDLSTRTPPEEKIERSLDNPQGVDIDFSFGQPLKQACEFLADAHGITIIVDEKALQDVGIQPDEQLSNVLSGITLRSAIRIMLEPLGLTYVVDDDVMKITTIEVAESIVTTRVYDVRPLTNAGLDAFQIADAITETLRPDTWPNRVPQATASAAGVARPPERGERAPSRTDTGIVALNGALVVTHSQEMHRRIVALLDQLGRLAERPVGE